MTSNSKGFLSKVAGFLLENCETQLHSICIVLPNRRAGLFLKKEMASIIKRPVFLPAIFSIEDFVYESTQLQKADPADLLLDLFDVYRTLFGDQANDFETFMKWGRLAINDFDDIDQYLAEPRHLFTCFADTKAIEQWNPQGTPLTEKQQQYLDFFHTLHALYDRFTQMLLESGKAYNGLAFRQSVKSISNNALPFNYSRYIFAGFNFHTPAERKLIEAIARISKVDELFDADRYYVDDENKAAGAAMRKTIRSTAPENFRWLDDQLCNGAKQLTITEVAGNIGQAHYAGKLLSQFDPKQITDTALVLCDENLLMPVLNSLPDNISSFNVTMGYPIRLTPIYALIEIIFEMHLHSGEYSEKSNNIDEPGLIAHYYLRDFLKILQHPQVVEFATKQGYDISKITELMRNSGKVILDAIEIQDYFNLNGLVPSWVINITNKCTGTANFLDRISQFLKQLISESSNRQTVDTHCDPESIAISLLLDSIMRTVERMATKPIPITLKGLRTLFTVQTEMISIPFSGEPLSGLQILGMLETRLLDFSNVILLSLNEGVIPTGKTKQSFFPFDIRKQFGLPVHSDNEAVSAYHFYRLLQRATTVNLVYNCIGNELGGGEPSRFLRQIRQELSKANTHATINTIRYSLPAPKGLTNLPIRVEKNNEMLQLLLKLADNGLSPSAISSFVACPLRFYFRYILGIAKEDDITETMDSAIFGQIVHEALMRIYEPFLATPLTESMMNAASERLADALTGSFEKHYHHGDLRYGENYLLKEVAKTLLRNMLKLDTKWVEELKETAGNLILRALESRYSTILPVEIEIEHALKTTINVKIKGTIDRIDDFGGVIRVIDYKTGTVENNEVVVKDWDSLVRDHKKEKALQLLIYAWIYARENNTEIPSAGIVSLRKLSKGVMIVDYPHEQGNHISDKIEMVICTIIKGIFDASEPFYQTTNLQACTHCVYRTVCHR